MTKRNAFIALAVLLVAWVVLGFILSDERREIVFRQGGVPLAHRRIEIIMPVAEALTTDKDGVVVLPKSLDGHGIVWARIEGRDGVSSLALPDHGRRIFDRRGNTSITTDVHVRRFGLLRFTNTETQEVTELPPGALGQPVGNAAPTASKPQPTATTEADSSAPEHQD